MQFLPSISGPKPRNSTGPRRVSVHVYACVPSVIIISLCWKLFEQKLFEKKEQKRSRNCASGVDWESSSSPTVQAGRAHSFLAQRNGFAFVELLPSLLLADEAHKHHPGAFSIHIFLHRDETTSDYYKVASVQGVWYDRADSKIKFHGHKRHPNQIKDEPPSSSMHQ